MLESAPIYLSGVFVLGALIGSFLNVVILRIPPRLEFEWRCQCEELLQIERERPEPPPGIITGRSKCPHCGQLISLVQNIPILSYVFLKGRCNSCAAKISPRYPVVELTTAVLFVVIAWQFGLGLQSISAMVLTAFLVALTGIDLDHQLLPDNFTLPLMWMGILLSFWNVHTELSSSVIGAIGGYLTLWAVYHAFRLITGKEGMGYGDFKLLAALGAWMGWQMLPLIILGSSIVGATVGVALIASGKLKKDKPIPFGPFIAAAGWVVLIWGQQLLNYYFQGRGFG